jgi:hypothetical protein
MIGRMSHPSFRGVKTVVAAWTAPCLLFRKVYASIVIMLLAQPFLFLFAILCTGRAMVLVVMRNKVLLSLESLHWGAITTLPLFYLFTVFSLVPGTSTLVREGNVAGNTNFLRLSGGKEGVLIAYFCGLVNRRNLGIAEVGSLLLYSCQPPSRSYAL